MSTHHAPPPARPRRRSRRRAHDARPPREGESPAEDLDLEEDIAPNLGGEDQMQDA